MSLNVQFRNIPQRDFYYATERNQCFSGGFNNGKTFVGCLKVITLLLTFPGYRVAICRQTFKDLKVTTMQTFKKMIPEGIIASDNEQDGITLLRNGSKILWLHLDKVDESTLRGLEVNSILVDQAEEIDEKVYDVLDARLGRWDGVEVPKDLLENTSGDWPVSLTGHYVVPSYLMLLVNPDNQFHFVYRHYHPESLDRKAKHFYCEGEWDRELGSPESYDQATKRDPEWVDKYVKGKWGVSSSALHIVPSSILLEPTKEILQTIKEKGNFFRILDHGDSAPTCCLWVAAVLGVYIFYREYYVANRTISYHRKAISDLSKDEDYSSNYADPQIFKKTAQKDGGFWSVADEYRDSDLEGPMLTWIPADNNEFATRNRINELLQPSLRFRHPVTGISQGYGMYFIKSTPEYPYGCKEAFKQLGMQRKKLLGTFEGKSVYSDDRDDSVQDHAYDCIRYFVAMHGTQPAASRKKPSRNSFAFFNQVAKLQRDRMPVPSSVRGIE